MGRLKRWWVSTWQIWLLATGHIFATLFLSNLSAGLGQINDPEVRGLAQAVNHLYLVITSGPLPLRRVASVLVVVLLLQSLRRPPSRLITDLLGTLLSLRCALQFVLLNLLLLAELKEGSLLLLQLLLFLPVITLNFGWLYWRLDSGSRRQGRSQIRFEEEPPHPFDYFHVAAIALLQFDPSGAKPLSRRMKTLFVLHGVVMMDLVALTLSRAIGLANA
ncbi:hypothetical protein [Vulcanococcus sp.]|jgi:hypothetical protein|uniref:hypothetical protein n=1 Tax=Vulcanococcus sp. TaxID=2856995 RepID=UPI0037DA64A1